jgi:hypothetical protein
MMVVVQVVVVVVYYMYCLTKSTPLLLLYTWPRQNHGRWNC